MTRKIKRPLQRRAAGQYRRIAAGQPYECRSEDRRDVSAVPSLCGAQAQQTLAPEPGSPADQVAQTGTVAVSQVKLVSGVRASKLIGAAVHNDANERIGSVDDLILSPEDKAVVAIIQVGGFLGAGGKLVAVPYHQLQMGKDNKLVIAGANKDSLNAMPDFTYGGSTGTLDQTLAPSASGVSR